MYLSIGKRTGNPKKRGTTNRLRAKFKAKNRRRVNRMHGRKLGARLGR